MGRTCCVQKLILTFRTIYVHNMFSPCSAKIRASDKDLPVSYNLDSPDIENMTFLDNIASYRSMLYLVGERNHFH